MGGVMAVFSARRMFCCAGLIGMLAAPAMADAAPEFIYISDLTGRVARFDPVSSSLQAFGNLNSFGIDQILGIAFDPVSQRILMLDRQVNGFEAQVYSMNSEFGSASFLFEAVHGFEGGAVKNNLLYGLIEGGVSDPNPAEAYSLPGGVAQGLSGGTMPVHMHAMGVDSASGQLYVIDRSGAFTVRRLNDDGSIGSAVITPVGGGITFPEDIDYYHGDFLVVGGVNGVTRINGGTGA